jgi:hypothetical protein
VKIASAAVVIAAEPSREPPPIRQAWFELPPPCVLSESESLDAFNQASDAKADGDGAYRGVMVV